jgi:AcrR family transcriptional regulator
MDVAERHLGEGGYLGVSLEVVAREVGVSKPALYYHFPGGKEGLFVAIAHRALAHHRDGLERAIAAHEAGADKLRAVARWLMSESNQDHPMDELRDLTRFVSEQHKRERAFLSLLSGMLQVNNAPAGPRLPEATRTADGMADYAVDLFLNGVLP